MDILFILLVLTALYFGHVFTAVALGMLFVSILTWTLMKEVKLCAMVTYKALSEDFKKQLGELNTRWRVYGTNCGENAVAKNHYVTKRNRRPKNKRRKDCTADTMRKLKLRNNPWWRLWHDADLLSQPSRQMLPSEYRARKERNLPT